MTRLSTGFRINSAMDDAAGLQIATRLNTQSSGMNVAMRNTQNSISLMQTAEGALDETSNILNRMKDLATQAADGSSTAADQTAMQAEFDTLTDELSNIFQNTKFGGTSLFNSGAGALAGKLTTAITFQIGAASSETMTGNFTAELTAADTAIDTASTRFVSTGAIPAGPGTELTAAGAANTAIGTLSTAIDAVGALRSKLGAISNRLDHVYNNLSNISTNTKNASGRIMDVDFASESAKMTSSQMLLQAGTAMLKQSNSQSSLVMSLLQ
jgi:flagellin